MGPAISDYNKRLILLTVIQLSDGHCIMKQCKLSYKFQYAKKAMVVRQKLIQTVSFGVDISTVM
jgi:hypothetical protein